MDTAILSAAFITLLNVLVLFIAMGLVGRARGKHGIKAPACSGNEQFECAYRAHMNTVEQTVMFLPVLWIYVLLVPAMRWALGLAPLRRGAAAMARCSAAFTNR